MVRRFRCSICGHPVEGKPPNIAVCRNCKAYYIFKYAKKREKGKIQGHYILAGFYD